MHFRLIHLVTALLVAISYSVQAGPNDIIISQGSSSITQQEFDARISKIPKKDQLPFLSDGSRVEDVLRKLIMNRRIADKARDAGLHQDPVVKERIKLAIDKELTTVYLEQIVAQSREVADFELMAKEYYLTHKNEFIRPASIDVSHILISTEQRNADEAAKLIAKIREELIADPSRWGELVQLHSEDPGSRSKDGQYLGVVPGKMVKPFEDAAFALEVKGDLSAPVKTEFGYHLIRLDAKHAASTSSFEEVKDKLVKIQQKKFGRTATTEFISSINTSEPLVIPDCAIEEMMERYYDNSGVTKAYQECLANKSTAE